MIPTARVIADSISPDGDRLTTIEATMHRFVLAEINTHRKFCLAGDAMLVFDMPSKDVKPYSMSIAEFVDKWINGAAPRRNHEKRELPLHLVDPMKVYSGAELSELLSFSKPAIHAACRQGQLRARKSGPNRSDPWLIDGQDFIDYRSAEQHNRQPVRYRLSDMRIRQVDELSGEVKHSNVVDACISGVKEVWELTTESGHVVAASADHRILCRSGWKRLGDIVVDDEVLTMGQGKRPENKKDPLKMKRVDGAWRSVWQRKQGERLREEDPICRDCRLAKAVDVAHIVGVHEDPSLTFDESNITYLCKPCHRLRDSCQGWQEGNPLCSKYSKVVSIESRGIEQTYDLEIAGEWPNFFANGIVVHNSRNSASSRAIPLQKQLARVKADPAFPLYWGAEQKGMQSGDELSGDELQAAQDLFENCRKATVDLIEGYVELAGDGDRLHKSLLNRLIEPFMSHVVVASSTEWENFFSQRCSPLAQPEIRAVAEAMRSALNESTPRVIQLGEWHTPFIQPDEEEMDWELKKQISAARCARVSYLTQDGVRDPSADLGLYVRLVSASPPHWSPLEHVATPAVMCESVLGNFDGWHQLRHLS